MTIATANTNPISPARPALSWNTVALLNANITTDGSGAEGSGAATILTAGVDGARISRLRVQHRGINVATVMRFFVNNGLDVAVPANNALIAEVTIPALAALSQVAANPGVDVTLNIFLKGGFRLRYSIGTAVATGHIVTTPDAGEF